MLVDMTPLELDTDDVLAFVVAALPPSPATVLEVGAGDGRLAAKLVERGHVVTAIDLDADAVAAARARGVDARRADVLSFEGGPFDAVLYTRSFHHVWPLEDAVARSRALVAAGGVLVLDELAHDAIDLPSAAWFYDVQALLEETGALAPDERGQHRHAGHHHPHAHHGHPQASAPRNPLERWRDRHGDAHEHPLHGGQAMLEALASAFELTPVERGPYLYRYLAERLAPDAHGGRLFHKVRALEQARLDLGLLVPVGRRIVARAR